jgi:hypothetical protein
LSSGRLLQGLSPGLENNGGLPTGPTLPRLTVPKLPSLQFGLAMMEC